MRGPRPTALGVLVATLVGAAGVAAQDHPCGDPCLQAARAARAACASSAQGTYRDALDGCLERDLVCVDACRWRRQECRDGTGVAAALAACDARLDARKAECRRRFPPRSERREDCIDRAQVAAFRCRDGARERFRAALRTCRAEFGRCVSVCGPGGPPGGSGTCRAEAKSALQGALATCRQDYLVTASACVDKDVTCVQACAEDRSACNAPTQATLEGALGACTAQEAADVAACQAANPGGGQALDQCIDMAQANAFACRDAALEAAAPGFAACEQQYVSCVRACPPA